jgi:hypothetical protein
MDGALILLGLTVVGLGVMLSRAIKRINDDYEAMREMMLLIQVQSETIDKLTKKLKDKNVEDQD